MQAAGIAEADPSLDIEGWDAAAKTAALVNVLMGGAITPHQVARTGITEVQAADVQRRPGARTAHSTGRAAPGVRVTPSWRASSPRCWPADDPLAGLADTANALYLHDRPARRSRHRPA